MCIRDSCPLSKKTLSFDVHFNDSLSSDSNTKKKEDDYKSLKYFSLFFFSFCKNSSGFKLATLPGPRLKRGLVLLSSTTMKIYIPLLSQTDCFIFLH